MSLIVLFITLPLFAFKAIENTQQKSITQFDLVNKSILTSGNLEIENIKTIEAAKDMKITQDYDQDNQNSEGLTDNMEMYENVKKIEEDLILDHDNVRNILKRYVVQVARILHECRNQRIVRGC
jgi:hypothetical protein